MRNTTSKRRWLAALIVSVALLAPACGDDDDSTSADQAGGDTTMRVALILPSARNDLAFSQSMHDSVESLTEEFNLEIAVTDNAFVVQDAANAIRQYASEGYDLVIAHGSQYGSTLQQLAPEFPEVSFAWGTAGDTFGQPNINAYEVATNEGGYVQGYMAALLSTSKVIGIIGPIDVGDAELYVNGFTAGALAADPEVNVQETFTGSFSDVSLMANAARAFITNGADVLTGTAQAVVGAIGVAQESDVAWFSNDWDQSSLAPNNVVSSNVYDWTGALTDILTNIQDGTLGGEAYTLTLENGGEKIEFNPDYPLPDDVKSAGEGVMADIVAGTLTVPE